MKPQRIILLTVFLMSQFCLARAQSSTCVNERKIRAAVISTINEYEITGDFHDKYVEKEFKSLFADANVQIYSDLMEYRPTEMISIDEYVKELSGRNNISMVLSELKIGKAQNINGNIVVVATLNKTLTYTAGDVLFSSESYFESPYTLSFTMIFDENEGKCKIQRIEGNVDSEKELLNSHFYVVQHALKSDKTKFKFDNQVLSNGFHLSYNDFGQAFAASGNFVIQDYDCDVIPIVLDHKEMYDYVSLSYTPHHFRIKPLLAVAGGFAYSFDLAEGIKAKSMAVEEGVDIGYSIPLGEKAHLGLYAGLRFNTSTIDFYNAAPFSYTQDAKYHYTGPKGQTIEKYYQRSYMIESASEGARYVDLAIPLYLGLEFKISPDFRLEADLGIKKYSNLNMPNSGRKAFSVNGTVVGMDINGSTVAESEEYRLGAISINPDTAIYVAEYQQENPLSLLCSVNVDYLIIRKYNTFASFGIGFEQGLKETHIGSGIPVMYGNEYVPVLYNQSINTDRLVRTYMESATFTRQAIWINFGMKIKL